MLQNNFEDPGINTDELRLLYYGQEDHVRIFSENQLMNSINEAGFNLQIVKNSELGLNGMEKYYGVNDREDLILALKP